MPCLQVSNSCLFSYNRVSVNYSIEMKFIPEYEAQLFFRVPGRYSLTYGKKTQLKFIILTFRHSVTVFSATLEKNI